MLELQLAPSAEEPADRTTEKILDAALKEAGARGLQRLTVEDVVRRAGVARMTVYRRYPSREDLVQALVNREVQRFLQAVTEGNARADDPFDKLVEAFIAAVEFTRRHPLLRRARDSEPGWVMEGIAADEGRLLALGRDFIAAYIHGDRRGAPSRRARWIADVWARLFVTYAAVPPTDPDFADDRELRRFAREVLAPMVSR